MMGLCFLFFLGGWDLNDMKVCAEKRLFFFFLGGEVGVWEEWFLIWQSNGEGSKEVIRRVSFCLSFSIRISSKSCFSEKASQPGMLLLEQFVWF